jgi:hypothetical protein
MQRRKALRRLARELQAPRVYVDRSAKVFLANMALMANCVRLDWQGR